MPACSLQPLLPRWSDFVKQIDSRNTTTTTDDTYVMTDGNYILDSAEADALDLISSTAGVDVIDGGGSADKCRRWGDGEG